MSVQVGHPNGVTDLYERLGARKLPARPTQGPPRDAVSADYLLGDYRRAVVESTGRDDYVVICLTTRWRSRNSGRLLAIETITDGNWQDRLRCDAIFIGLQTPQWHGHSSRAPVGSELILGPQVGFEEIGNLRLSFTA